jgi:hypothetical protein
MPVKPPLFCHAMADVSFVSANEEFFVKDMTVAKSVESEQPVWLLIPLDPARTAAEKAMVAMQPGQLIGVDGEDFFVELVMKFENYREGRHVKDTYMLNAHPKGIAQEKTRRGG